MAGIGHEEYPELTLSDTIEIVAKVGHQNVKTTTGLAEVMGLKSTNSGYFYHQVSALTKYFGVINRNKDSVSLTPLGQRIAHPISDSDRRLALAEAASRVSLLQGLYSALGQSFHDADFRTKLREVTGATPPEIEKTATFIERLYRDAIPYISQVPPAPGMISAEPREQAEPAGSVGTPASSLQSHHHLSEPGFRVFESDGVFLKVKKDQEALEEAEAIIQAWLKRYTKQPSQGQTRESPDPRQAK
jgi:hypothetical protein